VNYSCKIRVLEDSKLADKETKLRSKSVVDVVELSFMVYLLSQVLAEAHAYVTGFVRQNLLGRNM
jgi:hypothetical protein